MTENNERERIDENVELNEEEAEALAGGRRLGPIFRNGTELEHHPIK